MILRRVERGGGGKALGGETFSVIAHYPFSGRTIAGAEQLGPPAGLEQIVDPPRLVPGAKAGMIAPAGAAGVGEDEDALVAAHEGVGFDEIGPRAAVLDPLPAVGADDPVTGSAVVAHVVPEPGADTAQVLAGVEAVAAEHLAVFKRPARVVAAERLPRTRTGKGARSRLRDATAELS